MDTIILIVGGVIALALLIGITEFAVGRFSGWHKLLALLAAIGGGLLGYTDDKIPGAIGGAAFGGLAGYLLGGILFGVIGAVWLSGAVSDEAEPSRKIVTLPERIILSIFRLVAVAVIGLVVHELFWLVNATALVGNYAAGVVIANESAGGEDSSLKETAADVRWRVSVFTARPLRWCMIAEVAAANAEALKVIDDARSASPTPWQNNGGQEATASGEMPRRDKLLEQSIQQFETCLQRGWLTRFIPTEWVREQLNLSPAPDSDPSPSPVPDPTTVETTEKSVD